jgi:hypothetical protein
MAKEYTHELNNDIRSIAGGYELEEESVLELDGREVLYALGHGVIDTACCGVGGCRYALVAGYLTKLKVRQNDQGLWVSEVEPIEDENSRREVTRLISEKEQVNQVQFW